MQNTDAKHKIRNKTENNSYREIKKLKEIKKEENKETKKTILRGKIG
jgi:hypothetical protein